MDFAVIKEHPVASVAVLGVGCIVLYALMSGGGSPAASADPYSDPSYLAAELQAGTQMAGMQLAAQSQDKQLASDAAMAKLAADVALNGKYSDNSTALAIANGGYALQSKQLDAGVLLGTRQIDSDTTLGSRTIDADTIKTLGQFKQVTDVAQITSNVNLAGIAANRDTSIAATTALSDAQKYTAGLAAQTQQDMSRDAANTNASNQKAKTAGGILNTVASFLPFLAFL